MAQGQYAVMTDRKTHRAIKLLSVESETPMGSIIERVFKALNERVSHEFKTNPALNGTESSNFHLFLGLHLVDTGVMKRVEFEAVAKNRNLEDVFLTVFDMNRKEAREYLDNLSVEKNR